MSDTTRTINQPSARKTLTSIGTRIAGALTLAVSSPLSYNTHKPDKRIQPPCCIIANPVKTNTSDHPLPENSATTHHPTTLSNYTNFSVRIPRCHSLPFSPPHSTHHKPHALPIPASKKAKHSDKAPYMIPLVIKDPTILNRFLYTPPQSASYQILPSLANDSHEQLQNCHHNPFNRIASFPPNLTKPSAFLRRMSEHRN